MRVIWKDDKRALGLNECLTVLATYQRYKDAGENYREEVDALKMPYVVKRDIRNTTPSSVFDVFTSLYEDMVKDLNRISTKESAMMQTVKEGSWNPVRDLIEEEIMVDAIGMVLQKKYMFIERMNEDEAYEKAVNNMKKAKRDMKSFMGTFMSEAAMNLMDAVQRYDLSLKKGDVAALRPKVRGLDWQGLVVSIEVDDKVIMLNDEKDSDDDDEAEGGDINDPMFS